MKAWKKLLAMLLCLVMLLSLVACGDDSSSDDDDDDDKPKETEAQLEEGDKDCAHVWKDWVVMKESTCTKSGTQRHTCDLCGREEEEKISYTGHMYVDGECEYCDKTQRACEHEKTKTILVEQQTCEKDGRENEICSDCYAIVDVSFLYATGHSYVYHEYQDPTCTEVGWYSYNTCENCDYSEFPENKQDALGHNYVAGVCTVCAEVKPGFETITVTGVEEKPYVAPDAAEKAVLDISALPAEVFTGTISERGQIDTHTFTAKNDGTYYIWISQRSDGLSVDLFVLDSAGTQLASQIHTGVMTLDATAGEVYTIMAEEDWSRGDYELRVAQDKPVQDITGYGTINDSLEHSKQINIYTYVPESAGTYRFELSGMTDVCRVKIEIFNADGKKLKSDTYASNGDGLTVDGVAAGEALTIYVEYEYYAESAYTLSIGSPKPVADVSGYTSVSDSVSFTNQTNCYTYVAPYDGNYHFMMSGMDSGEEVTLRIRNASGDALDSITYAENYDAMLVNNMVAGQTYTIEVAQLYDYTAYTVEIGTPSAPVEMKNDMAVVDQIDYNYQFKTYIFKVEEAGNYRVAISGMDYYSSVNMKIFDADGEEIDYDSSVYNNDGLTIFDAAPGSTYTIRVYESYYLPAYTISIQTVGE